VLTHLTIFSVVDLRAHHGPRWMGRTLLEKEGAEHHSSPGAGVAVVPAKLPRAVAHRTRSRVVVGTNSSTGVAVDGPGRISSKRSPLRFPGTGDRAADGAGPGRGLRAAFSSCQSNCSSVRLQLDIGMAASATLKEYFGGDPQPNGAANPQDDLIRQRLPNPKIDGETAVRRRRSSRFCC